MADLLIIGGGPGGMSTALWGRRLELGVVLLEASPRLGGQVLHLTQPITDVPGLAVRNGPQLALRQHRQLAASGVDLRPQTRVEQLRFRRGGFAATGPGGTVEARYAVVALGARPRTLGIPGEESLTHPASHRTDKRWHAAFKDKVVAVVGGGDSALTDALDLAEQGARVHVIHRREAFRARAGWASAASAQAAITCHMETTVEAITPLTPSSFGARYLDPADAAQAAGRGRARTWRPELASPPPAVLHAAADGSFGLRLASPRAAGELTVAACFIRAGIVPASGSLELPAGVMRHEDGRIKVGEGQETAVPGLFAVGDCTVPVRYASIATALGQGMRAAKRMLALQAGNS